MDNNNLEYGVNSKLVELCAAVGLEAIVLNDFTRADLIVRPTGQADDLWVGIQLKTTRSHVIQKPSCWQFDHIKGYKALMVICVVCNNPERNWIFDGDYLHSIVPENLCISAGGKYDHTALAHGSLQTILDRLKVLVGDMASSSGVAAMSERTFRTDFLSEGHAKEFRLFELFDDCVAAPRGWTTKWPPGASLTYDKLITFDKESTWKRAQFKSVSRRGASSGMRGKLTKKVHKKTCPYDYDDADLYVFLLCDPGAGHMDVWMLSRDLLVENGRHLTVDCVEGTGYITLHLPEELLGTTDVVPQRKINGGGGRVSQSLWTAGNHMRVQIA